MIRTFKESYEMLNLHIKDVLKLFTLTTIASILGSVVFPIGGFALSLGIFIYTNQIILQLVKTEDINVVELQEPFYPGVIKAYIFKLLLGIPIIASVLFATANFIKGIILIGFSSIYFNSFKEGFFMLIGTIATSASLIILALLAMQLLFPFTQLVFLDEDFKDNSFFKNVKLSFRLAKGYRFKVFLLMMLNNLFAIISILTFGLALIYFYPLYLITLSKLYIESKKSSNVLNVF